MSTLIMPYHFRVYERQMTRWFVWGANEVFYNPTEKSVDLRNVEQQFGLTKQQVVIELFRINAGRTGFYLANLRDKEYYYCGLVWEDIKVMLLSLGVGRNDPTED